MIQPISKMLGLFVIFFGLFTSVLAQQFKRGIGFNDNVSIVGFGGTSVFWGYNWGSSTSKDKAAEWPWMEYTPMLWGPDSAHTSTWNTDAQHALSNLGSGHLLAFNEPDICTGNGCCVSPQDACNSYRTWMQPFAGSAGLVSPAVSNAGLDWMSEFLSVCTDVKIDYVAFHWYDQWNNIDYFHSYLSNIKAIAGSRKIWLTEFEGLGNIDQQSNFIANVIPILDNDPQIDRYSYFGMASGASSFLLNDGTPNLSPLGVQYATASF